MRAALALNELISPTEALAIKKVKSRNCKAVI